MTLFCLRGVSFWLPFTGMNRRKLVQRVVMEELVNMVDPGEKAYELKKGEAWHPY